MSDSSLVAIVIRNSSGKYLFQMRDNNPGILCPLMWCFFGGHIEKGELIQTAAKRELFEELGIESREIDFTVIGSLDKESGRGKRYLARYIHNVDWAQIMEVREGAGAAYFTLDDVIKLNIAEGARDLITAFLL